MNKDRLAPLLTEGLLQELYTEETVSSTNTLVKELFRAGKRGPLLYVAEVQTAGRGRLGRTWNSPSESGIWMSLLDTSPNENISSLTLVTAVAVTRAIRKVYPALAPVIKWPNDILLPVGRPLQTEHDSSLQSNTPAFAATSVSRSEDSSQTAVIYKKFCGILTEATSFGPETGIIFGIGINCTPSAYPPELAGKATSLAEALSSAVPNPAGCPNPHSTEAPAPTFAGIIPFMPGIDTTPDREAVILAFVPEMLHLLREYSRTGDLSFLLEEYNNLLIHRNRPVYLYRTPTGMNEAASPVNSSGEPGGQNTNANTDVAENREGPFTALGIRADGALLIQKPDGDIQPLISGEISVRGENGYI